MRNTDIILLIPLVWGIYRGFYRGFIREITSIVAMAVVLFLSLRYTGVFADYLHSHFQKQVSPLYLSVAAFVILFLGLFLIVHFIAIKIEKASDALHLSLINHLIGGFFGLLKWAFLVSIAIFYLGIFSQRSGFIPIKFNRTWTYNTISGIAPGILPGEFHRNK